MKIRIPLTVEVDPEAWELEYGTIREDLREDVRRYVLSLIDDSAAGQAGAISNIYSK